VTQKGETPMLETRILSVKDNILWKSMLAKLNLKDPHYLPEYLQIYEEMSEGEPKTHFGGEGLLFFYGDNDNFIIYPFFKRPINVLSFHSFEGLYDIISPYGYGGPLSRIKDETIGEELWRGFFDIFDRFCCESNIVSEFCRLHPLFENHKPIGLFSKGTVQKIGRIVYVDLNCSEEELITRMGKHHRRHIRTALRNPDLNFHIDHGNKHIHEFYDAYIKTMQTVKARSCYQFSHDFFENATVTLGENLIPIYITYRDTYVSGLLTLRYNNMASHWLSGAKEEYLHLFVENLLHYASLVHLRNQGAKYCILGGGLSAQEDSLFRFKLGFSELTKGFYIYKMIHLQRYYDKLIEARQNQTENTTEFFPQYRLP
jgi:hypothetical protein